MLKRIRMALRRLMYEGPWRDRSQAPDVIVAALGLEPGDRVADLGSGTGYFTIRLARAVGPTGVVYAIDTDEELLEEVVRKARAAGLGNVVAVRARPDDAPLPEPVDLVFLAHSYHHLPDRPAYFARLGLSLRPGGRVAIVEARPGGWLSRWFGHVSDPADVRREMAEAGFRLVAEYAGGRNESFQVFELAINHAE